MQYKADYDQQKTMTISGICPQIKYAVGYLKTITWSASVDSAPRTVWNYAKEKTTVSADSMPKEIKIKLKGMQWASEVKNIKSESKGRIF
jgi:hypothetical protein